MLTDASSAVGCAATPPTSKLGAALILDLSLIAFCSFNMAPRPGAKLWIPIEANPDVYEDFAHKLGVTSYQYQFHDVFGLDEVRLADV